MYLEELRVVNFKNFEEKSFQFSPKINAFVGNNGIGKTNVLDAVYYLSFFKSYFNHSEAQNVRFGEDFFTLEGKFNKNNKEEILQSAYQKGQKKVVKRNQKVYERIADHVGLFPSVIISPYDRDLILEGSEVRRKFMDSIISQSDHFYLTHLIKYNKILSQRNALLKYFAANRTFDKFQLEIYDDELIKLGEEIHNKRVEFINQFLPKFKHYYDIISNQKEEVKISYSSDLECDNPENLFKENLEKDRLLQYTTAGIHKDDLKFKIIGYPIKKFGSQGQQKSFLIALKLAQLEFIKEQLKITPILLLDDIFDKLDEQRVEQLIQLVNHEHFGQIFISDTHPERTESVLKRINEKHKIFKL